MKLTLAHARPGTRSEITAVGISPSASNPAAYAIYAAAQSSQSWIDIFDIASGRPLSKIQGNYAVFGPRYKQKHNHSEGTSSEKPQDTKTTKEAEPAEHKSSKISTNTSTSTTVRLKNMVKAAAASTSNAISSNIASSTKDEALAHAVATLRDWTVELAGGVEYHHNRTVALRDFVTGKTLLELREATGEPVVWSADGRAVAACDGKRCRMSIWDTATGERLGRVISHTEAITHAVFTADGGRGNSGNSVDKSRNINIVTLSRDGTLRLTDPRMNRTLARLEVAEPAAGVSSGRPRALAVSPDGSRVVCVWASTVTIWAPFAGQLLASYNLSATRAIEGWPLCISTDCRYMACWTEDGFDMTDVPSGQVLCSKTGGALVTAAAFSRDGRTLLLGRIDGALEFWNIDEGKSL